MRALIGKVILLPPSSVTSRIDFCHEKKKKNWMENSGFVLF